MTHNERVRARVDAFEAKLRRNLNPAGIEPVSSQGQAAPGPAQPSPPRVCRGCGCTDDAACALEAGSCAWQMQYDDNTGVCTACAPVLAAAAAAAARKAPRPPVLALVYYIPAAGSMEMYFPVLRKCLTFDVINGRFPTLTELNDQALQIAGQDRTIHIEFRAPRDNELTDPPAMSEAAAAPGYCTPVFGQFQRGYVRTAKPRLPGTAPVACPLHWFRF
ncbi:hypothetical protein [Mycobacteroides salmoniphilum]|uniref:Uncharacterized protein n=1 Tax=Mycobacteroides salmoniphilum TaxID=404941 RepID=A0A4R8SZV2_9MYCO|nr:hypothetical protein [Mycobacteroides salmoniphilum]TEA09119.1 hypothetical protein CCUG60884_00288 [Mycobacteroides salmoniphilum]